VAGFVAGDVVVVPFPFTDLRSLKRRPALVLAAYTRGDVLLCQITSQAGTHPDAIAIEVVRRAAAPSRQRTTLLTRHIGEPR
jgi:mRNA interferase MazF